MKTIFYLLFFLTSLFSLELQKPDIYKDQDISNWHMSEKLDGIRGYWDGENLYTKKGNPIHVPADFTKNFPPFELDGELYTKRNDFENIQSIVLDEIPSNKWKQITYNIFEVPNTKGDFPSRLEKAKKWFEKHPNKNVKIIKQIKCKNKDHLNSFLDEITILKGEGVIIKDPSKAYNKGRTPYTLKVKKFFDMEGEVIGHNYKEDKSFKSLVIKLDNGTVFNLGGGFSGKERQNPPKIGQSVTFKYYDLTKNGKPKFASFLRIREKE